MNNDISADFKYINAKKQNKNSAKVSMPCDTIMHENTDNTVTDFKNSMMLLGNMGCAKVNMDKTSLNKNTAKSVEEYLKDTEYAKWHTDFCDELVNSGYSLEDAIIQTDNVFNMLREEKTYE